MKILLLGLGRANLPVAEYLVKKGEGVFVYDENIPGLSKNAREMIDKGQVVIHNAQVQHYDLTISSPGFTPDHPICRELRGFGVSIIDEIEFVFRELHNPNVIAVTGTNGKSTTAALISSVLREAQMKNFLGGNIAPGRPFSHALLEEHYPYYVLEVSSFQLSRVEQFHAHIAVLTNLSIDHLNWHQNIDTYKAAKLRIFSNQNNSDFAALNYDDDWVRSVAGSIKSSVVFFGYHTKKGVCVNGAFHYEKRKMFSNEKLPLGGRHNMLNMAAAVAVAKIMNIDDSTIEVSFRKFRSLPHRLESLGTFSGIRYINNSMCTNASAAIASFQAIEGPRIVILGGKHKGDEGKGYFDVLIKGAKACVILGENARFIAEYFKSHAFIRFTVAKDMVDAVRKAQDFARPGDIIMLNPGFASFDYFGNFEERGEAFRNAVQQG